MASEGYTRKELEDLSYKDVQKIAKGLSVRANGKKHQIIRRILSHFNKDVSKDGLNETYEKSTTSHSDFSKDESKDGLNEFFEKSSTSYSECSKEVSKDVLDETDEKSTTLHFECNKEVSKDGLNETYEKSTNSHSECSKEVLTDGLNETFNKSSSSHSEYTKEASKDVLNETYEKSTTEVNSSLLDSSCSRSRETSASPRPGTFKTHFAAIHQKYQSKMINIQEDHDMKQKRCEELLSKCPSRLNELSKPKKRRSNSLGLTPKTPLKQTKPNFDSSHTPSQPTRSGFDSSHTPSQPKLPGFDSSRTPNQSKRRSTSVGRYTPHRKPYVYVDTTKMSDRDFAEYKKQLNLEKENCQNK